jgi:class 3 adenylate cyclase/predicted ATPase
MPTFDEILTQVVEVLRRQGRVAYGALKRRFALDDAYLQDLKDELIEAQQVARDEGGKILVWKGSTAEDAAGQGTAGHQPRQTLAASPSTPEAERRQLTVMFCDLVGSTPLAEKLDPEDLRQVILAYQQTCAEQIRRFDEYLARYVGDGLLVYFGYPQAHEDDAQRAIRTGLGIVAALPDLNTQLQQSAGGLQDFPLQVRIGIHTGLVVVGDMGGGDYRDPRAIVGETPNIAARLQGIAESDTVVLSAATQRLVQGLFDCQPLGQRTLKGVSAPLQVYRVVGASRAQSRLEVDVNTGRLTPLVGRANELGLVLERWAAAQAGDGQVVLLSGEPGIGKSRLVQEVKERVRPQGATSLEFRCSPYSQNSAFYPVITYLHRVLHFERDETPQAKLEKLQQALARYRFPQADTLHLLAALLSVPGPPEVPPLNLSPQKQKQRTQEALVAWLVEEAERQAVYCTWEDLHWADPSTIDLLGLLLDQVPTTRLLVLLTARPEFTPPWSGRTHLTPLTLARLPRTQVTELIEKVTGGKPLPAEVHQQIVRKTDGVPLFVEELTKMVLESGLVRERDGHYELTGPLPPLAIPTTLQDSLMARLDRLATAKDVAQLGATLGREFSYDILQAVAQQEESRLQQTLAKLVEAEVLYQRGLPPQARYIFKHALIQEAAYQSLLKSTRQQYHRQIAQVLEERFPDTTETQPGLLAYHYTEAGLSEQAIPYWWQTGQQAVQRSAHVEAIRHLSRGLELLKTLPNTFERGQQELTLQLTLGVALIATKGWAAPEIERVYHRARELCQQGGETVPSFWVLLGLWVFHLLRADLRVASELGEQLLALAQHLQDPALLIPGCYTRTWSLFALGESLSAQAHWEQATALYTPAQHHSYTQLYSVDFGVGSRICAALALWCLGYPDQAVRSIQEACTLARQLAHSHSLAFALEVAAIVHQLRGERQDTQERAEAAVTLATEQGFPVELAMASIPRDWAVAEQGQSQGGIASIQQNLTVLNTTGARIWRPYFLALLAEAYGKTAHAEEGLLVLAEALATVDKTQERWYEAELYRLRGELILKQSQVQSSRSRVEAEVEICFQQAIVITRRQSAKSLELRAVMSLSRLWQQQGKRQEAHALLAEIHGWFTEGFKTKDLQEAKALLESLGH